MKTWLKHAAAVPVDILYLCKTSHFAEVSIIIYAIFKEPIAFEINLSLKFVCVFAEIVRLVSVFIVHWAHLR